LGPFSSTFKNCPSFGEVHCQKGGHHEYKICDFGIRLSRFSYRSFGRCTAGPSVPFAQRQVTFENGVIGKPLTFESATPRNFEEVIGKAPLRSVKLDGQLFVHAGPEVQSVVILAPGSGGVTEDNLKHAQALTSAGLAVYVLDPFAGGA